MNMAYHRVEFTPDDNNTLLVTSPDFPELTTFGNDRGDAIFHARGALEEAIEARIADKKPIPRPCFISGIVTEDDDWAWVLISNDVFEHARRSGAYGQPANTEPFDDLVQKLKDEEAKARREVAFIGRIMIVGVIVAAIVAWFLWAAPR